MIKDIKKEQKELCHTSLTHLFIEEPEENFLLLSY
jgi:hypothetical protein